MRFPAHSRRTAFDLAIQQLRDGRPGEAGYGRRLALLLTIPAFDDPVARDVRRSATGELYIVRTVWNRALDVATAGFGRDVGIGAGRIPVLGVDLATFRAPSIDLTSVRAPSLHSMKLVVDPNAIDALLESVVSATVPCRPQHAEAPLDATIFELTFGEELNETRYRWHAEAPEGWTPLVSFATRLIRLVDEPAGVVAR